MKQRSLIALMAAGSAAIASLGLAVPVGAAPAPIPVAPPSFSSIASVLPAGTIVTGARGDGNSTVVLTGETGTSATATADLYVGPSTATVEAAATVGHGIHLLAPSLPGVTTSQFYSVTTHAFNPSEVALGQYLAVGTYNSSVVVSGFPAGTTLGMIYRGDLQDHGTWSTLAVPQSLACPGTTCTVTTFPHSVMGHLVVGTYEQSSAVGIGMNGFIYDLSTKTMTVTNFTGRDTSLYGIWQNGGDGSSDYTIVGGSNPLGVGGLNKGLVVNYNASTHSFGSRRYFTYKNQPSLVTHFEGITQVPGGFNLAAEGVGVGGTSLGVAHLPVNPVSGTFGTATWSTANVLGSGVCSSGCKTATANTVFQNQLYGITIATAGGIQAYQAVLQP